MLENKRDFTNTGNKVNLAERIKEIRTAKGWSQEKMAEIAGVTRNTVFNWESEISMPSINGIIAIADALEISLDELLGRKVPSKEVDIPEAECAEILEKVEERIQDMSKFIRAEIKKRQRNAQ